MRLIFLLGRDGHPYDNSRLILKQLLKTVQAHPGGMTVKALKKLIEIGNYTAWAADVQEVLRDGALNAGSDPERAASLPQIELPVFSDGCYADMSTLEEHFGRLLEPRLYDRAHSDYLEDLAKLSCAIEALPEGDGRGRGNHPLDRRRRTEVELQHRRVCQTAAACCTNCAPRSSHW